LTVACTAGQSNQSFHDNVALCCDGGNEGGHVEALMEAGRYNSIRAMYGFSTMVHALNFTLQGMESEWKVVELKQQQN
jgi:hypothetical protein